MLSLDPRPADFRIDPLGDIQVFTPLTLRADKCLRIIADPHKDLRYRGGLVVLRELAPQLAIELQEEGYRIC